MWQKFLKFNLISCLGNGEPIVIAKQTSDTKLSKAFRSVIDLLNDLDMRLKKSCDLKNDWVGGL